MTFDPTKVKLTATCKVPGILYALCYDETNRKLYGAGSDWSVHAVDLRADKLAAEKKWTNHENYVSAVVLLDNVVVSTGYDGRINWTNADTAKQVRSVAAHDAWVRSLAVFPDGKSFVSVGDDMLVKLWNAETGELLNQFDGHAKQTPQGYTTALYAVAITPDGKHIASGDRIGTVCIWEADSGKLIHQLQAPTFYTYDPKTRVRSIGGIRSLCFSPDGTQLAIAGIGKVTNVDGFVGPCRVELWDWQSPKHIRTYQDKHKAVLNDIHFHPTEHYLITAGGGDSGGILAFWDMKNEQPAHKAKPKGHIQKLLLDIPANQICACGHEGFRLWSMGDLPSTDPSLGSSKLD